MLKTCGVEKKLDCFFFFIDLILLLVSVINILLVFLHCHHFHLSICSLGSLRPFQLNLLLSYWVPGPTAPPSSAICPDLNQRIQLLHGSTSSLAIAGSALSALLVYVVIDGPRVPLYRAQKCQLTNSCG